MSTTVTITVIELVIYWVSGITLSMIAAIGWALYVTEKKKRSKFVISPRPLNKKKDCTTIISEPQKIKDKQSDTR